ncbi:MAG: hypothetical protein K2Q25_13280 [Mycobacteriaceae bacterium]|nr:hypothetical protein [Mycobacteriaceae bacterium]
MGQTNSGAREFVEGQKRFLTGISTLLGHANPDPDRWSGEAADNYQTHNAYQQSRVNKMVDADSRVVALLHEQGDEVEAARRQLAAVRLAVTGAIAVASVMLTAYVRIRRESYTNLVLYKKAEAMGWALVRFIQASLLGMAGNVIDVITNLGIRGTKTKNRINNVIGDYYRWVINDWHKHQSTGVAIGPTRTAAPATALPGFTDLLDAQSAAAASANEADAATGSRQRLPVSAFAATPVITGLDQRRVSSPHALQRPSPRRLGQGHEADSAEGQVQQPTPAAPQPAAPAIPVLGAGEPAPIGGVVAAQA